MNRGKVTLVGGGPGDEKLLTVAALDALACADVILYDRLAPIKVLDRVGTHAVLVNVGKHPGHHAIPQDQINALLIQYASQGLHAVRFKGGDPFVFGRGSEEAAACREHGIEVEVIPGISSCIAVPESAGIPVTARGISHSFTVISGHNPLSATEHQALATMAKLGGTVVVLMGISTLPHLISGLLAHGLRPDLPVAVIERGYSPDQRTTISTLCEAVRDTTLVAVRNPAVMVLGEVVKLTPESALRELATAQDTVIAT